MLYKGPPIKIGIEINGHDIADLDPFEVKSWLKSQPKKHRELIEAIIIIIRTKMIPDDFDLPDDYAKHAGRPSLKKVPYMRSENDGLPYLPGHSPTCDGKFYTKKDGKNLCQCKYDKWNHEGGSCKEMWPGVTIDDFDM